MSTATGSNLDRITAFLRAKGLTAAQIAGVEGNLQTESGFRPTAYNPSEGAIGLAQWENGRRTNLQRYAASVGSTETNLDTQLGFLWSELTGSESGALHALLATTTPAQAATVFDQKYERSAASSLPARVANAEALARGGIRGGTGQVDTSGAAGATAQPVSVLGDLLGGLAGALGLDTIGHWIVDGVLILSGVGLVITGVLILARGGDATKAPTLPGNLGDAPASSGSSGKGGASSSTEAEAAEAAA